MQQKANTVDNVLDAARLAELTTTTSATSDNTLILDQIAQLKAEVRRLGRDRVDAVQPWRSPTPERRRVSFGVEDNNNRRSPAYDQQQFNRPSSSSSGGNQGHLRAPPSSNVWPPKGGNQYNDQMICYRCGRQNCSSQRGQCSAYGKTCYSCNKLNHVARMCRAAHLAPTANQSHFQY